MFRRRPANVTRDTGASRLERPSVLKLRAELYKLRQRNADLLADNCALRRQRTAIERSVQELTEYLNGLQREAEQLREDNRRLANRGTASGIGVTQAEAEPASSSGGAAKQVIP